MGGRAGLAVCVRACMCACLCSHLQVSDELSHGDLLGHAVVQAVAVQHHALQDGQRALQDGHVHHGLVHITRNLGMKGASRLPLT